MNQEEIYCSYPHQQKMIPITFSEISIKFCPEENTNKSQLKLDFWRYVVQKLQAESQMPEQLTKYSKSFEMLGTPVITI